MASKKQKTPTSMAFSHPDFHREVFFSPSPDALPSGPGLDDYVPPRLSDLPSWADARRVGIDLEVRDEDLRELGPGVRRDPAKNYVVGIAFAIEDGPEHYLPMRHHAGDNCSEGPEAVWSYVRDNLRKFRGVVTGAKLEYDMDWMEDHTGILGLTETQIEIADTQVADPMIYELHDRYNLDVMCERHGLPGKDEEILRQAAAAYRIDPKKEMWKMRGRYVAKYGATDARRPLQLLRRQEKLISENGLSEPWEMEKRVTPLLVKMRRRGVRIDMDLVGRIEQATIKVESEQLDRVHSLTGVRINVGDVWKADILAHALRVAGYKIPLTDGGKSSVDKEFLDKCGEVGEALHTAREWNKLRTTFAKQMRQHSLCTSGEYRIHGTLNQMKATDDYGSSKGVAYGRTSMTNPNLQQQPVRHDDFGELWRSIFVANLGGWWACNDWSQQEPRIAVDYAERLGLEGAKEFADAYRANPRMDIHQRFADITSIKRKICKNYVNGRIYGMGDLKTCRHIDQPTVRKVIRGEMREVPGPDGQAMIDKFNKFAPWIKGLTKNAMQAVERKGYIRCVDGRRFHFEKRPDGSYMDAHAAFNRVGQYEASRMMKLALIEAEKSGIPIQLIVHDEFDFSWTDVRQPKMLKEIQLNVVKYGVPMLVDCEVGNNWGKVIKLDALDGLHHMFDGLREAA